MLWTIYSSHMTVNCILFDVKPIETSISIAYGAIVSSLVAFEVLVLRSYHPI